MADITLSVNLDASAVKSTTDSLQQDVKNIFDKASTAKDLSAPFKNLLVTMDKLAQKSASIKQKLEDLEKTPDVATPEYAKLSAEYDKLIAKQDRLNDRMTKFKALGGDVTSKSYKSMQYDMSELGAQIAKVQAQKDKLEHSGQAFTPVVDTTQYQNLLTQLNGVNNQLTICRDKAIALGEVKLNPGIFDRIKSAIGNVGTAIQSGLGHLKSYFSSLSSVVPPISMIGVAFTNVAIIATKAIGGIFGLLGKLPGYAVKAGSAILNIGKGAVKATTSVLKLAAALGKLVGGGILNGLKKLGSAISGVGKHASSSSGGFEKGFKSFIRYGLGVRSIFALVNKLRRALISGFENLAQVHEPFNRSVSNIISSVNLLKNTVAGAFAPIIEAVEPALVRLINLFSEATVKVGQFIAAITGKEFVRANYVQKDYAASLDATKKKNQAAAKAAKEAAKAAKKQAKEEEALKKQLLGFDDVEILHEDKDKDTDSTDPTAGLDDTLDALQDDFSFTESPIDSAIEAFVEKFKEAWLNADFYDIGRIVGEKLKKALDSIPWDFIKKTAWRIARSIATFLNGFLETPGLFMTIGRTLAQGLNTAFVFAETFASNFHWDSLGKAILQGILGFAQNIDWPLIYKTFAEYGAGIGTALNSAISNLDFWQALFSTGASLIEAVLLGIDNFITNVDWSHIAFSIANRLNVTLAQFNWALLANTIIDAFNSIFDFVYTALTTFDFYRFGGYIGSTLSTVLREIDWAQGGASVGAVINALFDALNGFIAATDWRALGAAVINAIGGFFTEFDASKAGEFIANIPIVIFETLSGAVQAIDWAQLPTNIINFIKDFLSGFDWAEIANLAGELVGAAFRALVEVGSSLWKTIKDCWHSLMDGGFEGILDALKNVGKWIYDHIFKPFIDGFKDAFGIHSPAKTMEPLGTNIIEGLFGGISDKISGVHRWIKDNIFTPFTDGLDSAFEIVGGVANKIKYAGKSMIDGLEDGLANNWNKVEAWVSNNAPSLKEKFEETDWLNIGSNICSGIEQGLSDGWDWLTTSAWNLATDIYNSARNALDINSPSKKFDWIGEMSMKGLASGFVDNKGTVISKITDITEAIEEEAEKANPSISISESIGDWINELDNILTTFGSMVSTEFDRLVASMGTLSMYSVPAVAQGKVVPPSSFNASSQSQDFLNLQKTLDTLSNTMITYDDLQSIIVSAFQQYLNINFYLEDEQLARHANAGNLKLDRRYNIINKIR